MAGRGGGIRVAESSSPSGAWLARFGCAGFCVTLLNVAGAGCTQHRPIDATPAPAIPPAGPRTFASLTLAEKRGIESTLRKIHAIAQRLAEPHWAAPSLRFWPTDLELYVGAEGLTREELMWGQPDSEEAFSFVVRIASIAAPPPNEATAPRISAYLRPELLNGTQTCVLRLGGDVDWITTTELREALFEPMRHLQDLTYLPGD